MLAYERDYSEALLPQDPMLTATLGESAVRGADTLLELTEGQLTEYVQEMPDDLRYQQWLAQAFTHQADAQEGQLADISAEDDERYRNAAAFNEQVQIAAANQMSYEWLLQQEAIAQHMAALYQEAFMRDDDGDVDALGRKKKKRNNSPTNGWVNDSYFKLVA